jgi:hypothetical protein
MSSCAASIIVLLEELKTKFSYFALEDSQFALA